MSKFKLSNIISSELKYLKDTLSNSTQLISNPLSTTYLSLSTDSLFFIILYSFDMWTWEFNIWLIPLLKVLRDWNSLKVTPIKSKVINPTYRGIPIITAKTKVVMKLGKNPLIVIYLTFWKSFLLSSANVESKFLSSWDSLFSNFIKNILSTTRWISSPAVWVTV